jgi:hypothetical protein
MSDGRNEVQHARLVRKQSPFRFQPAICHKRDPFTLFLDENQDNGSPGIGGVPLSVKTGSASNR